MAAHEVIEPRDRIVFGRAAVGLCLSPVLAEAQTAVGNPAGGFIVLLLICLATLAGLVLFLVGVVQLVRGGPSLGRILLTGGGLVLFAPVLLLALAFGWSVLQDSIPRSESWDFSSSRSVAGLDPRRRRSVGLSDHDTEYSYQGNIRSTVRLPGGRTWSGAAFLVIVEAKGDTVTAIDWQGRRDRTAQVYAQAARILKELSFTGHNLDSWYEKVRRGEKEYFRFESATSPRIQVDIRGIPGEMDESDAEKREWYVNVYVAWN